MEIILTQGDVALERADDSDRYASTPYPALSHMYHSKIKKVSQKKLARQRREQSQRKN